MARVCRLTAADLSGSLGAGAAGFTTASGLGSLAAQMVPGFVDTELYENNSNIVWKVTGNVTSALAGLTHIKINGTDYAVTSGPTFASGSTTTQFAHASFAASTKYSVELVGLTTALFDGPEIVGTTPHLATGNTASVNFSTIGTGVLREAGDTLGIIVMTANQSINTTPAGWTVFTPASGTPQRGTAGAAGGVRTVILFKDTVAAGTEGATSIGDGGDIHVVLGFVLRPGDSSTGKVEIDDSIADNIAATTSASFSGPTTTGPNRKILYGITTDRDFTGGSWGALTNANLANIVEVFDNGTATNTGGGVAIITGNKATAGAVGTATATQAASAAFTYQTLALKNASSTPSVTVNNAAHAHATTSPTLGAKSSVTPNAATHGHSTTSPTLGAKSTISPDSGSLAHTTTSPGLAAKSTISPDNASHTNSLTEPAVGVPVPISPDGIDQAHVTTEPTLTPKSAISPGNVAHDHATTSPDLAAKSAVSVDAASHAHTTTAPSLATSNAIEPDDAVHGHSTGSPNLGTATSVAVDDVSQGHATTSPSLGSEAIVTPASVSHGHELTEPSLSGAVSIIPSSASHTNTTTSPTLAWSGSIAVNDNHLGHSLTEPTIAARSAVTPNDAQHAHNLSEPDVIGHGMIVPASILHAHLTTSPSIFIELPPSATRTAYDPVRPRTAENSNQPRVALNSSASRIAIVDYSPRVAIVSQSKRIAS